MMMVQSPVNVGLSSAPDHAKQEISSCVWIPGDVSWQIPTHQKNTDSSLCSENLISSSQLSAEVNTSESSTPNVVYKRTVHKKVLPPNPNKTENFTPNVVYKRRTIQKAVLPPNPNTSYNPTPKVVYKRRITHKKVSKPNLNSAATIVYKRKKVQTESKSGSVDRDELIEGPKSKIQKCQNLHAVNDSCSSSKSNVDLGSGFLKQQVDDVGECSSSGVVISEPNSCFEFLKQHGVLERIISTRSRKPMCDEKNLSRLKSCKVCDRMKTTLKLVICDLCEESFHMSCCSPPVRKVPVGDWFCHSCSKKKLEKSKEASSRKLSEDYAGPITSMLRDAKPYTSNVRVGEDFQVEVQDWSGPLTDQLNDYVEPTEISSLECASYLDWGSSKLSRLSPIGNWLQCQQVVNDVVGTVCGKWRRAPLFEVQTDNWECFSSVLWDPTHADCAVPQELETEQVLKQLKYIELLRPRLSAKKWKLGVNKKNVQREHSGEPRSTQKS